ncbi:MAG TPA: DUF4339 domain-containing protein [Polyangiaceae bacterium]|nr:DUF4339 domain-containing protein [Polyangiaceae bacterium]
MTASFGQQEIWHVMIASDDMKQMNVDQLDDAYRLDLVSASTLVWKTGMEGWRRLGSIAGIDDEPETIARPLAPPAHPFGSPSPPLPPRLPRPTAQPRSVASEINPFASTTTAAVFEAPRLLAPVYTPPVAAPEPYVLPKRRVKVLSEVDFRRASGIRWGRWMFGFLLLTTGVLAAYRQDYLHQGARHLGIENKYIHGERRVTGWVTANTPPAVQAALTRLKLLPGPNASPTTPPKPAAMAAAAVVTEPTQRDMPMTDSDGVKTVSLDSLPTEQEVAPAAPAPAAAAPAPAPRAKAAVKTEPKPAMKEAAPPPAPVAKAKPEREPEAPKLEPKAPPAAMNDTPLKAAIWQAMQEDAKKK